MPDIINSDMPRYKDFAPTGFDRKGLGLPDRQDWFVTPVSRTRDSDILTHSNWCSFLKMLENDDNYEIHRFGHWGPGWFEIILVRPGSPEHQTAWEVECALADYPVLDEWLFSEMENAAEQETWDCMSLRDRIEVCARFDVSIFAARRDYAPHDDQGAIREYLVHSC